jgi:hypothetical protein
MDKLKGIIDRITRPSKMKVFYRGDFFVVSPKEVVKTSKQRRVDVVLFESDEVRQERFEVNVPLGKKEIYDYAALNLEPVLGNRSISDYYIFAYQLKEPGADGKYYVSVVFFPKQFTEDIFRLGIKGKEMMPMEFCLAGYCKMAKPEKPSIYIYKRGEKSISVLSVDGFPFEVIKDYVRDDEESGLVSRIVNYFLSTYPYLKIDTVYVSGFSSVPSDFPGVSINLVKDYDYLKGVLFSDYKVKVVDFYLESLVDAAALIAIPVFLAVSSYAGYKLYNHMDNLDNAKEEMRYASDKLNELKNQLMKQKQQLMVYQKTLLEQEKVLSLIKEINPKTVIKLSSLKEAIAKKCDRFKDKLFIEKIYLESRKNRKYFVVEGKIISDEKKKIYEIVNDLKSTFPGFKSLTNPPRPPSVKFRIEEDV